MGTASPMPHCHLQWRMASLSSIAAISPSTAARAAVGVSITTTAITTHHQQPLPSLIITQHQRGIDGTTTPADTTAAGTRRKGGVAAGGGGTTTPHLGSYGGQNLTVTDSSTEPVLATNPNQLYRFFIYKKIQGQRTWGGQPPIFWPKYLTGKLTNKY